MATRSSVFSYPYDSILWSYNPDALRRRFGLFPFRSPLLRESRLFSLPPGTEMFHFPGFAPIAGWQGMTPAGLPHSDIRGSKLASSSPRHFVGCHVLHRLSVPRHPPCALAILPKVLYRFCFFFRVEYVVYHYTISHTHAASSWLEYKYSSSIKKRLFVLLSITIDAQYLIIARVYMSSSFLCLQ